MSRKVDKTVCNTDYLKTEFARLSDLVKSIGRCALIAGRRKVWDHLADMYRGVTADLWIMGEGADLSDEGVRADFKRLRSSTVEALSKKNVVRVQTFDSWISWYRWLEELISSHSTHFSLYFTTERLKFVPQLNIRDRGEDVVAVPPEESVDIAYAMRIIGQDPEAKRAIRAVCTQFIKLQNDSIPLRTANQVASLRQSVEAIKELQVDLLIACEFVNKRKVELTKAHTLTKFKAPEYRSIQQYFTLDHNIFKKRFSKVSGYKDFVNSGCKTLGETIAYIFPKKYSASEHKSVNYGEMAQGIIDAIPLGAGNIDPKITEHFLEGKHIVSSAVNISQCLSNAMYFIARKITKTTS